MAEFTVRVVLHHTDDRDEYEKLHQSMENGGFERFIQDDESAVWYRLPGGEYINRTHNSLSEVLDAARLIVATVHAPKNFGIFVSQIAWGWRWRGLKERTPPSSE